MSNVNLYDQFMEQAAEKLANEIDADLMRSMLKEIGWYEVVLEPMTWEQGIAVDKWTNENVKNGVWYHGLVWMFKDSREAMWFRLNWL